MIVSNSEAKVKSDLKKYKDYTILFNAKETDSGEFKPIATLFKSGEDSVTLNIESLFNDRDSALSFALGAAEETVDAKLKGKKPNFKLLVSEQLR